jgi:DNA-directed RNA polymerase subunit RPC12/RpoP
MPRITHVHDWRLTFHTEGCHSYQSAYHCYTCGADLEIHDEECSPYNGDACERCQELQAGVEPKRTITVKHQEEGN